MMECVYGEIRNERPKGHRPYNQPVGLRVDNDRSTS